MLKTRGFSHKNPPFDELIAVAIIGHGIEICYGYHRFDSCCHINPSS